MSNDQVTELFDKDGNLIGAILGPQAWNAAKQTVCKALGLTPEPALKEPPEPLADWETLKQYWDFPYPVDTDVQCPECGNSTADWSADEPRRFRLTGANLGGLVAFRCQKCRAKIIKRHFKDKIKTESVPFQPTKDIKKESGLAR
ncbi:MAG: hypothetical protein PHV85_01895 [Desulfovibrionaceae bacterium]|nr:hypothetical protein [Desulfovibrionaceae bacterium]